MLLVTRRAAINALGHSRSTALSNHNSGIYWLIYQAMQLCCQKHSFKSYSHLKKKNIKITKKTRSNFQAWHPSW
jgi:hypothetical protein